MTIPEVLSNEELRRHEFPVTRETIYLAHAGVCPLPRRVFEAIRNYSEAAQFDDQETVMPDSLLPQTRQLAARLLQAEPGEIALVGPTSLGLSFVASGLQFRKHDNIVVYFDDYPSNVYPWMALAEKGVQIRFLNIRELGKIRALDVMGQVDEQTRLVALASAHFVAGWRIDIPAIGKFLRERNILFCVDAIQTLGAFPVSVEHVDFLAADAHKWLLGPCAAGIFYVRKSLQDQLRPPIHGWHNVKCPNYVAQESLVFRADARRYEVGTQNVLGVAGLRAALELVLEVGTENIAAELLRKRVWLAAALQEMGYAVLHGNAPSENSTSILSFFHPTQEAIRLQAKLAAEKIIVSLRTARSGRQYIRLSPHFYNTDAELQRVVELLT